MRVSVLLDALLAYYYNLAAQDRKVAVCATTGRPLSVQESLRWSAGEDTERRKPFQGGRIRDRSVIFGAIPRI